MAWATGTATNYLDLVRRLRDFLTTDSALVALGQNWTQISQAGEMGGLSPSPTAPTLTAADQIMLQGPGLAGDDQVLVSLQFVENAGSNLYNVGIRGQVAYQASVTAANQPGTSAAKYMLLLNTSMKYWFIANGRCFKVIVQAGGAYEHMYGGFILPEHLPQDWPYPLFAGASSSSSSLANTSTDTAHHAYFNAYGSNSITANTSAVLCLPDLNWRPVNGQGSSSWYNNTIQTTWSNYAIAHNMRQSLSGLPVLIQGELFTEFSTIGAAYYGRFDGVFYVPAFGRVPEEIATIDGIDYLLVPDVIYTSDGNYAAFALE